jgi:hypothetical protein
MLLPSPERGGQGKYSPQSRGYGLQSAVLNFHAFPPVGSDMAIQRGLVLLRLQMRCRDLVDRCPLLLTTEAR